MAFMAVIKISNNPVSSRTVCLIHFYYIAFWQIVNIRENIRKNYVKCAVLCHYLKIYIVILVYTFIKINAKTEKLKRHRRSSLRSNATEQRLLPKVNRVTEAFLFTAMLRYTKRHRRSGAVYKYNSRILRFPASGSPPQSSGGKPPRANEAFLFTAMLRQNKMRPRQTASLPRAHFGGA